MVLSGAEGQAPPAPRRPAAPAPSPRGAGAPVPSAGGRAGAPSPQPGGEGWGTGASAEREGGDTPALGSAGGGGQPRREPTQPREGEHRPRSPGASGTPALGPAPPRARYRPLPPPPPGGPAGGCALPFCALIMAARGHVQDPNDRRLRPIYGTDPAAPQPRSPGPPRRHRLDGLPRPASAVPGGGAEGPRRAARPGKRWLAPPAGPLRPPAPSPAAGEPHAPLGGQAPRARGSAAPAAPLPRGEALGLPPPPPSSRGRRCPGEPAVRAGSCPGAWPRLPPGAGSGSLAGPGGRDPRSVPAALLPAGTGAAPAPPGVSPLGPPPPAAGRTPPQRGWGAPRLLPSVKVTWVGPWLPPQGSRELINS